LSPTDSQRSLEEHQPKEHDMTQPSQAPGAPTDAGQGGLAPTEPQQPGPAEQLPAEPQDISSLPEWAQKAITKTREEAAGYRTKYKTVAEQAQEAQAQRDKVLAAFGLKSDGTEDQSPEKLTAQLQQFQANTWELTVENTVLRTAPKLGADAEALMDSNRFLDSLAELDDNADLQKHIADFVAQNPKFKTAQQGAPRGGGDFGGGPNLPPASIDSQIAEAEKKRDFNTVIALKRLKAARN
jgi:hypothetical protein